MLAQVKKILGDDFSGRFGAWWGGHDYVPPEPGADPTEVPADTTQPATDTTPADPADVLFDEPGGPRLKGLAARLAEGGSIRLAALEAMWGEGRFAPGGRELDSSLLDEALNQTPPDSLVGFIGVDGALLRAAALRSDRPVQASEWRPGCAERLRELAPNAQVMESEIDRPRGFQDASLSALVSVEAFAYADHKAGLVSRAARALSPEGQWIFLDTTRKTAKTPPAAFASSWAEPQLCTADEMEELLALSGFKSVRRISVTDLVLAAARDGFAQLDGVLEAAAAGILSGREGAQFLQEVCWEAESWKARRKALEGGALQIDVWVAEKQTVETGPSTEEPAQAFEVEEQKIEASSPQDAVDALFT